MGYERGFLYQDNNDTYANAMIEHYSDKEYWTASEHAAMSGVYEWLKVHAPVERMLDAGCGEGRLIPFFSSYAQKVYAIDPDNCRMERCKLNVSKTSTVNVRFLNVGIENILKSLPLEDRSFDFIVCSHVLQHVPTTMLRNCIATLSNLLSKKGRMMVTICFSSFTSDFFVASSASELGEYSETIIDENAFNDQKENDYVFSSHHFTIESITGLFSQARLRIVDTRFFHLLQGENPWDVTCAERLLLDKIASKCQPLRSCATDALFFVEHDS